MIFIRRGKFRVPDMELSDYEMEMLELSDYEKIILRVIRENGWTHELNISNDLENKCQGKINTTAGTLHTTLHTLELKGFITPKWDIQPIAQFGHPIKKYYKITAEGVVALEKATLQESTF